MPLSIPPRSAASSRSSDLPPTAGGPPHFVLWGIPVRVAPWFFLTSIVLAESQDPRAIAVWTAVVFLSVMLHEMGHALVARAFGARPSITLHGLGGLTQWSARMSRLQRGLVSLSGPAAGLAFGGLVYAATRSVAFGAEGRALVKEILWVNVGWGLVNLLPVLPFDGGHVLAAVLGPRRALLTAIISAIVGAGVAAAGWVYLHSIWIVFLFGSAAITAIRQARIGWSSFRDTRRGFDARLTEANAVLAEGDPERARAIAHEVAMSAQTPQVRNAAWKVIAWAHLTRHEGGLAREAVLQIEPPTAVDPYTLAAVADAVGEPRQARELLEGARRHGMTGVQMTKLLIDLYAREGRLNAAADLATEDLGLLGPSDARAVLGAALTQGAYRSAASLAGELFTLWGSPADGLDQARALAHSGDKTGALDALERTLLARRPDADANPSLTSLSGAHIAQDPAFAPLADDERFQRILSAALSAGNTTPSSV